MLVPTNEEVKREEVPYFSPVNPAGIPKLLKETHCWVCWKYIWDGERWSKPPLIPATGYNASVTDPSHRTTFDNAYAAVASGEMHGVSFILTRDNDIVGLDIDGCISKGKLNPEIRILILRLATYTAFSPSLKGVRLWLRVAKPKDDLSSGIHVKGFKGCEAFELYFHSKALTETGGHLNFTPTEINTIGETQMAELLAELEAWRNKQRAERSLSDDAIIDEIVSKSKGKALWAGDASIKEGDHSSSDSALAWMIAKYTKDKARIRRIIERSGLARDKWSEPRPGGDWLDVYVIQPAIDKVPPTQFNAPDTPQYERKANGMYENILTRHGDYVPEQLSNFSAQINGMMYLDAGDGSKQEPIYEVKCTYDGKEFVASLNAADLSSDEWPQRQAHPMASKMRICPIQNAARRFKAALMETSPQSEIVTSRCYTRMGWYDAQHITQGSAISAAGLDPVKTQLPGYCRTYGFPSLPTGEARVTATRASLSTLELRSAHITFPLLAVVYGAVLGHSRLMLHCCGIPGSAKTSTAMLFMQHFGASFSMDSSQTNWSATANAIEEKMVTCSDSVLLIDDLVLSGDSRVAQAQAQKVDQVVRALGNGQGRDRLDRNSKPKPAALIRCAVISTGETISMVIESALARMAVLNFTRDDLDFDRYQEIKAAADSGLLAQSMAAYIQWLAPQLEAAREDVAKRTADFEAAEANQNGARHARYGRSIGRLIASFELFTRFAMESGAIDAAKRSALNVKAQTVITEVIDRQVKEQAAAKPHEMFLEALRTVLVSGAAWVGNFDKQTEPPSIMPAALGWTGQEHGNSPIGYTDGKVLYLMPELARAAAVNVAPNAGVGIPDTIALGRVLKAQGLLLLPDPATDSEPDKLAKKVTIPGRGRPRVWKLKLTTLIELDGSTATPAPF